MEYDHTIKTNYIKQLIKTMFDSARRTICHGIKHRYQKFHNCIQHKEFHNKQELAWQRQHYAYRLPTVNLNK